MFNRCFFYLRLWLFILIFSRQYYFNMFTKKKIIIRDQRPSIVITQELYEIIKGVINEGESTCSVSWPRLKQVLNETLVNVSLFFQVFVANPNKTAPILDILLKNKDKLVEFLLNFHTDRTGKDFSLALFTVKYAWKQNQE